MTLSPRRAIRSDARTTATVREFWGWVWSASVCRLRGHQWRPYVSPVGWQQVELCQRCGIFNPMDEWIET